MCIRGFAFQRLRVNAGWAPVELCSTFTGGACCVQESRCGSNTPCRRCGVSWRACRYTLLVHTHAYPRQLATHPGIVTLHCPTTDQGYVCHAEILALFENCAKCIAVRGNVDDSASAEELPEHRSKEIAGWDIFVTHIADPGQGQEVRCLSCTSCAIQLMR